MKSGEGISDADERRIVELLDRDVAATVATDCHDLIVDAAARARLLCGSDAYIDLVVETVQQRLHDEFIDITWPACPHHPNHPLWLVDGHWTCTQAGLVIGPLGELRKR